MISDCLSEGSGSIPGRSAIIKKYLYYMSEIVTSKPKTQLPLLLTNGFFLFPKCNVSLPLTEENERLKPVLIQA